MKRRCPSLLALCITLSLVLLQPLAPAQAETWLKLPQSLYTLAGDAVSFSTPGFNDTYVFGFGWLGGAQFEAPQLVAGQLNVSPQLYGALQSLQPPSGTGAAPLARPFASPAAPAVLLLPGQPATIEQVRFGGTNQVRVVLDVPTASSATLTNLARSGRSDDGSPVLLQLPGLRPPVQSLYTFQHASLYFSATGDGTQVEVSGGPFAFESFALADPARFVIDLIPLGVADVDSPGSASVTAAPVVASVLLEASQQFAPGITYRQFRAPNGVGESAVHLLEVAPGAGEFRVVGTSEVARTLSELANGSLAAINAGYFNTSNFESIGLLRVDYGVQTLPTLNRASIGFGPAGTQIARVQAVARVRSNGRLVLQEPLLNGQFEINTRAGSRAGSAAQGVITVSNGVVTANRVGPLTVPADGFALVYTPETRELALVDPGGTLSYESIFQPAAFDAMRYAVEAGPLLVDQGRPAFEPDLERFQRGQRILDEYTSQAAIGVRADGTVLMIVANNMRAEDLIPLFIANGAWQAMRLDSGGSAALYADGRVLNRTSQRRIVSAIVLVPN